MGFSRFVVKFRKLICLSALLLCIPAAWGMIHTRVNYDMLSYLPSDLDTVKGQDILLSDFGKGAFSFIVVEGMDDQQTADLTHQIEKVDHVESALWADSLVEAGIPKALLPDKLYSAFNQQNDTIIAVFFDTSSSADETMDAIRTIRQLADHQVFVSGASAMVTDLKDLASEQEPVYVAIAVALALLAMELFLDNWLIPVVFLISIGISILFNMGTNYFLGEVSYITKALAAVLQLAVTMDYSIFLWNAFKEQKQKYPQSSTAMEYAIHETMSSIVGSSITTIAGFLALCFMTFTLGRDLGIVMAKGVVLGVLGCLTILPGFILLMEPILKRFSHQSLLPDLNGAADFVVTHSKALLVVMILLLVPAWYFNSQCQKSVYYNIGDSMPADMAFRTADQKLKDEFAMATAHMVLIDQSTSQSEVRQLASRIEDLDGVKYVLSLDSVLPEDIPEAIVPQDLKEQLESDDWKLMMIASEYGNASDEVNAQLDSIEKLAKETDPQALVIGEAPLSKDMIETTDHDFTVVNLISIGAIFLIILLVLKSISLPVILICVIELAIMLNMSCAYLFHEEVSFITPICISTIQLGATVDYAILLTTRWKKERQQGLRPADALRKALKSSIGSIIVSGSGLFAATFGVAMYSQINIISGMCMLMARGAIISMICVIFFLPPCLLLFDGIIQKTSWGNREKQEVLQ